MIERKSCTVVEGTHDGGDRIHQLEMQPFHVVGKQSSRVRDALEKSVVELHGELATNWPHRVERLPDQVDLLRGHGVWHAFPAIGAWHYARKRPYTELLSAVQAPDYRPECKG